MALILINGLVNLVLKTLGSRYQTAFSYFAKLKFNTRWLRFFTSVVPVYIKLQIKISSVIKLSLIFLKIARTRDLLLFIFKQRLVPLGYCAPSLSLIVYSCFGGIRTHGCQLDPLGESLLTGNEEFYFNIRAKLKPTRL